MSDFANATEAASLAVQFDQARQTDKAVECYRTAARLLDRVRDRFPPEKQEEVRNKVQEYLERATFLTEQQGKTLFYLYICWYNKEVVLVFFLFGHNYES